MMHLVIRKHWVHPDGEGCQGIACLDSSKNSILRNTTRGRDFPELKENKR